MTDSPRQLRVFLCHASADKAAVRDLFVRLKNEDWIDPWLDAARILPGQHWTSVIRQALVEADSVVILISNHSTNREGFLQREMNYAWDISLEKPRSVIYLIPLRLEDCEVPFDLRERQWADYFGDRKEETYQALLQSLRLRYDQKLRLEAEEKARQERLRLEAERIAHEKAEKEAAEKVRLEAEEEERQRVEKEKAEEEAIEQTRLKAEEERRRIAKEKTDREVAEKFAREKAEKEAVERARLKIEEEERQRLSKEKAVHEQAEKEAAEKARRKAAEEERQRIAREKVKREASEKAALEKAEKEAVEKARLKAEEEERQRIAREKVDRKAAEKAARENAKQIGAEKTARERTERKLRRQKLFEQIILNVSNVLSKLKLKKRVHPRSLAVVAILISLVVVAWFLWNNKNLFFSQIENYPTEIVDAKGVEMRLVTAGKFIMGANIYQNDGVQISSENTIYLDAYYIDKYEVTNSSYKECVNAGICQDVNISSGFYNVPDSGIGNFPVVNVNWSMASDYCVWRGSHLPTEAEWEKAARGTDGRNYPWGEEFDETIPNYGKPGGAPAPVGRYFKDKSPYEVYDMSGNVDEWVADWYSESYYQDPPKNNPQGPDTGTARVVKGGSFSQDDEIFLTAYERSDNDPNFGFVNLGFRCAIAAEITSTLKPLSLTGVPLVDIALSPTVTAIPPTKTLVHITNTPVPTLLAGSVIFSEKDGMTLLYVPAGDFTMGNDDATGFDEERPAHRPALDAFWIDRTEVTNNMYAKCVSDGVCKEPSDLSSISHSNYFGNPEFNDYPVIYVDWNMATTYCIWAERRLPSEAEWEKAARGIDGRTYPWGEDISCDRANYNMECSDDTTKVGTYENGKSPYGAYDMAGNVEEWVDDWYGETYYQSSPSLNPLGPSSGESKVWRGGSFAYYETALRSSYRNWLDPSATDFQLGFRCAMDSP